MKDRIVRWVLGLSAAWVVGVLNPSAADTQESLSVDEATFFNEPAFLSPQISPSGAKVAVIVSSGSGQRRVLVLDWDGSPSTIVDATDAQRLFEIEWLSDEHLLFSYHSIGVLRSEGRAMPVRRRYIYSLEDESYDELDTTDIIAAVLPDEPDQILLWQPVNGPGRSRIQQQDREPGSIALVARTLSSGRTSRRHIEHAGDTYLLNARGDLAVRQRHANTREIGFFSQRHRNADRDVASFWFRAGGEWVHLRNERLSPALGPTAIPAGERGISAFMAELVGLDASGEFAYFSSERSPDGTASDDRLIRSIFRINLQSGNIEGPVARSEWSDIGGTFRSYLRDWRTNAIVGVRWIERARQHTQYFDVDFENLQTMLEIENPAVKMTIESWSFDFTRFVVSAGTSTGGKSFYLYDQSSGQMRLLGREQTFEAPVEVTSYHFTTRDGTQLAGVLTLPINRDETPLALILMPPFSTAAQSIEENSSIRNYLAAHGYAVFQPNTRGVSHRGVGTFMEIEAGDRFRPFTDLIDAIDALSRDGVTDPERTCLVGFGVGAMLSTGAALSESESFTCMVLVRDIWVAPEARSAPPRQTRMLPDGAYIPGYTYELSRLLARANQEIQAADDLSVSTLLVECSNQRETLFREGEQLREFIARNPAMSARYSLPCSSQLFEFLTADQADEILVTIEGFVSENLGVDR